MIYKQKRVTQYNRRFKIWEGFRTAVVTDADKKSLVTSANDSRITKGWKFHLPTYPLDELPQLVNVLKVNVLCGTIQVPRYTRAV